MLNGTLRTDPPKRGVKKEEKHSTPPPPTRLTKNCSTCSIPPHTPHTPPLLPPTRQIPLTASHSGADKTDSSGGVSEKKINKIK